MCGSIYSIPVIYQPQLIVHIQSTMKALESYKDRSYPTQATHYDAKPLKPKEDQLGHLVIVILKLVTNKKTLRRRLTY